MTHDELQRQLDKADELLKEARIFFETSDYNDCERCALEALELLTPHAERNDLGEELDISSLKYAVLTRIAHVYNRLNTIAVSRGDNSSALSYAETAITYCDRIGDNHRKTVLTGNIGLVYNSQSDYPRALEYFGKALIAHEELGQKSDAARVTNSIGVVYMHLSDYPRALEYYSKALTAFEELGDKVSAARVRSNIGIIYRKLSDYPRALEYYSKALTAFEELGDKGNTSHIIGNIGLMYKAISDYPRALEYMFKALAAHEELGQKAFAANVLGNIGLVYQHLSDYPRALEYMVKALAAHEELGEKADAARVMGGIGSVYADRDFSGYDPYRAEEYMLKAIAMSEELGLKDILYENHKALAEFYEQQERWKESQQHFKKYSRIEKEVQSEEAKQTAVQLELKKQIAEREKEIAIAKASADAKHQTTLSILNKTLPPVIADRLIAGEKDIADRFESVSILFADIVGFTPLSTRKTPRELIHLLNNLFSRFDKLTEKYGVERIKTIGDAYMIVSGAPEVVEDHALRMAQTAFGMLDEIAAFNAESGEGINLRIGVNSGEAIAAVVGDVKFTYDLWSDAVNTASRMESHGEPGKIHVSEEFKQALQKGTGVSQESPVSPKSLLFQERGEMDIKGKGKMKTYFLQKATL